MTISYKDATMKKIKIIVLMLLVCVWLFGSVPVRASELSFPPGQHQYVDTVYTTYDLDPVAYKFTDMTENRVCYVTGVLMQCFDKK